MHKKYDINLTIDKSVSNFVDSYKNGYKNLDKLLNYGCTLIASGKRESVQLDDYFLVKCDDNYSNVDIRYSILILFKRNGTKNNLDKYNFSISIEHLILQNKTTAEKFSSKKTNL